MYALKSIIVHLDGTERAAERLVLARDLAQAHRAELRSVLAIDRRFMPLPVPVAGELPDAPLLEEPDPRHIERARAAFERHIGGGPLRPGLEVADEGSALAAMVRRARLTDLVVFGRPDPGDPANADVPAGLAASVIVASGTPGLVLPHAVPAVAEPETVLLAWNDTREAARALASALPMLARARCVHVATARGVPHGAVGEPAAKAVAAYLRTHGILAVETHSDVPDQDAGGALLSMAADVGADLLVMGCHGRGPAAERVLGGATKTVLDAMTLPVWMAH
jgi:nucleotide-binding universal stress UspA family protein